MSLSEIKRAQSILESGQDRSREFVVFGLAAAILIGILTLPSPASGQTADRGAQTPFIGFQSFDGTRQPINGASSTSSRISETSPPNYAYPAAGTNGYLASGSNTNYQTRTQTRLETSSSSQMSRVGTSTGALNHSGSATLPLGAQPTLGGNSQVASNWNRPNPNPASQVSLPRTNANSGWTESSFRTAQATLGTQRAATQPNLSQANLNNTGKPRLNEPVVQQTNSTMSSTRTSVARATTPTGTATTVARPPQNCVCVPNTGVVNPAYFNPNVAYQPNYAQAANQAPSLQSNPAGYPFQPGLGVPQFGSNQNVLTPFFRGSGVYTPLLPLFPMQPGTYLGQGIIGQPTAYVDGQPLRNLLRYVSP